MKLALRSGIAHTVWLDDLPALLTAQILYAAEDDALDRHTRRGGERL